MGYIEDRRSLKAHSSSKTIAVYTHPNSEIPREYINKLPTYSSGDKRVRNVTKLLIFDYISVQLTTLNTSN